MACACILRPYFVHAGKALARLRIGAGSPEPLLCENAMCQNRLCLLMYLPVWARNNNAPLELRKTKVKYSKTCL